MRVFGVELLLGHLLLGHTDRGLNGGATQGVTALVSAKSEVNFEVFLRTPGEWLKREIEKGMLHLKCQLLSCSGEIPMGSSSKMWRSR